MTPTRPTPYIGDPADYLTIGTGSERRVFVQVVPGLARLSLMSDLVRCVVSCGNELRAVWAHQSNTIGSPVGATLWEFTDPSDVAIQSGLTWPWDGDARAALLRFAADVRATRLPGYIDSVAAKLIARHMRRHQTTIIPRELAAKVLILSWP